MTREEEIRQAAARYAAKEYRQQSEEDKKLAIADFTAGAEWADEHSTWISVEERLPDGYLTCKLVFIKIRKYDSLYEGYYDGKDWYYIDEDGNEMMVFDVTHWMPIPELPTTK